MGRLTRSGGQASVEAIAGLAALLLTGAICFQLLAAGHVVALADGAAQAAAVAAVNGGSAERAARRSLPGWAAERAEIERSGGAVRVWIRPPSVIGPVASLLRVSSAAQVHTGRIP